MLLCKVIGVKNEVMNFQCVCANSYKCAFVLARFDDSL